MKALREAVREGHEAVEKFCAIYRLELPLNSKNGWEMDGTDSFCTLFDPIELADIYTPLYPVEEKSN